MKQVYFLSELALHCFQKGGLIACLLISFVVSGQQIISSPQIINLSYNGGVYTTNGNNSNGDLIIGNPTAPYSPVIVPFSDAHVAIIGDLIIMPYARLDFINCKVELNGETIVNTSSRMLINNIRDGAGTGYGSYVAYFLRNCSPYRIEANYANWDIMPQPQYDDYYLGIGIMDCGPDDNEVYRNFFGLGSLGIQSIGVNQKFDPSINKSISGLKILCNNLTPQHDLPSLPPVYDTNNISVVPNYPGQPEAGIHSEQSYEDGLGDVYAAGNRFNPLLFDEGYPANYYLDDIPSPYYLRYSYYSPPPFPQSSTYQMPENNNLTEIVKL